MSPGAPADDREAADLIDLADAGQILRRRWHHVALAMVLGTAAAVAVLLWAPRRFDGAASIVVRSAPDAGSSLLGRLGLPAELAPAGLGGALKSPLETELQILSSRSVLGAVSDSLGLQVRVLSPRGYAPGQLLRPARYDGAFRRKKLTFARAAGGAYQVRGPGIEGVVTPTRPLVTPVGRIALADGVLPPEFTIQLLDREDALKRLAEQLDIGKAGGEVVAVGYGASDSLSAADVPNAIVRAYLARRRTSDRTVNAYRAEFLAAQLDSVGRQLADAEGALRGFQETAGGVIDPELVGKIEYEGASKVRESLAANEVESAALDSLLVQVADGRASARQLAGYPTLLRSPAINEIVAQLARNEADRTRLMERRNPIDPEIVALDSSIVGLEQQLVPIGRAYAYSLERQRSELRSQTRAFDAEIARLPGAAQSYVRLQRDVRRLGTTSLALQSQLLDARLAAVGEGGDTRPLDVASVPKRVSFPKPIPTLLAGFGGGLVGGVLIVLVAGFLSPRAPGLEEVSRAAGLPAAALGRGSPMFLAVARADEGLAVAPLRAGVDAAAVARWLMPARSNGVVHEPAFARRELARSLVGGDGDSFLGDAGGGRHEGANGAHGIDVLPPLSSPEGMAALGAGRRVALVVPDGAARREITDAVAAIRVRGAEPVAVVVA
ncbi:MAG: GumC family protein [Gemmatirosa sp.]